MNNKNYTTLLSNNSNRINNNSNSRNMIYNQINNMNSVSRVLGTTSQMHNKRMYHSIDDRAPVIDGNVDKNEEAYKKNYEDMTAVINQLRGDLDTIKQGGGKKARELHTGRNKMLVRDRIDTLLDPQSPFLELSPLAG